jgi:arsenate reductase (glutaredoxin)
MVIKPLPRPSAHKPGNGQADRFEKAKNMNVTIYHNPRCSKSRQTLQLLEERGVELTIIDYLKNPPSAQQLKSILQKLKMSARDILRQGEGAYKQHNLNDQSKSEEDIIAAMVISPKLIERPIVIVADKAALGRPPQSVLDIL